MSFPFKIKTVLKILAISVCLAIFFDGTSLVVSAITGDDVESFVNDLFDTGEQGITFTAFEGQLAELSTEGYDPALTTATDLRDFIIRIVNFALGFLGLIAVIIVIYGGVLYVTAAGEEEKTQKGKKAITYATIGLLIVLGSFAFVNTVIKGAKGETDTTVGVLGEGTLIGGGFNASAEQVRGIAIQIYEGFKFLVDSTEELKNIKNDLEKDSLDPNALPSKENVLAFLNSAKSKMQTMESKMQPFSESKAKISDFIRELDKDIDTIHRFSSKVYVKKPSKGDSSLSVCDVEDAEDVFADIGQTDEETCAEEGYTIAYTINLYENWTIIRAKYKQDAKYNDIIKPIAKTYAKNLQRLLGELHEIYTNFENISVIKDGPAKTAFTLIQDTHFGFTDPANGLVTTKGSGFLSKIDGWSFAVDVSVPGQDLMNGLQQQAVIYEELKNLKFVGSRLSANVVEGAAPLTVLFDTVGSIDPAGGSISVDNIVWDLGGTKQISELFAEGAQTGGKVLVGDGVDCTLTTNQAGGEEFVIGNTAKRCIFEKPGTYRAAVKINSREPTKYAPGISILTIKVHPPTTKIELKVNDEQVMHYDGDLLAIDKNNITVTLNEASGAGVEFDASATLAEQFKLDYGDGKVEGYAASGIFGRHIYKKPGKYKVTLEVVNELGVVDKKIFTLEVADLAARININPSGKAFINTPVVMDGSGSRSDLGNIINYKWTINPVLPTEMSGSDLAQQIQSAYPPIVEEGANLKIFTHEFKYAIDYDIELEISDGDNTDTDKISKYKVESQPPVSNFEYDIPNATQPGTINLDGRASYDPDGQDNFGYQWTITPGVEGTEWKLLDSVDHGLDAEQPYVKFLKKGDYEVTLKIQDKLAQDEIDEITQTVKVDKIVDIAWGENQEVTAILNDKGEAKITFILVSDKAVSYEIDFGDGDEDNGTLSGTTTLPHDYRQAGKYPVKVTVFDEEDDENHIEKQIFIGGGDKPIARATLFINGEEVSDPTQPVRVSKKDQLEFDAGKSVNNEGKPTGLKYSWTFGDTQNSSKKKATHNYKELSPLDPGYFLVKLKVTDDDDPIKFDENELYVTVVNMPPTFSSVVGVPDYQNKNLITPVTVNVKVFEPQDPDGEIVKYKWWYFDLSDPDRPLGIQVTQTANAQLMIGTRGQEGKEMNYGFGLEVTDSDNLSSDNMDDVQRGNFSKITVINGKNEPPIAKFNVDVPSVLVGDQVNFTSSSSDADGAIIHYLWDVEGDGFHNNEPTDESSITHIYSERKETGYNVRLKVVDDKGGEAVSEPITIYVDSLAQPPTAAFLFEVMLGSEGMKVQFINNSTADESAGAKIISNKWDYDTNSTLITADSDGDGVKDNDIDSQAEDPQRFFSEPGTYNIKLTVTDNQGNIDDVTNTVKIPLGNPPVAAFTSEIIDGKAVFKNNSTADTNSGAVIEEYIWDFDTTSSLVTADSDGDGNKANDKDAVMKDPVFEYKQAGTYTVKLTVIDNQGNIDDVTNEVNFTLAPVPPDGGLGGDGTGGGGTGGTGSGGGTEPIAPSNIKAALSAIPLPGADGFVYLPGESGTVKFDFSKSEGLISYYIIDKNIYFDTDGNGTKNDDEDFKTVFPGTWTTNFEKDWGRIVSELTVLDINGNKNSTTIEIKFQ